MYILGRQTVKLPKEPVFLFEIVHQLFISIMQSLIERKSFVCNLNEFLIIWNSVLKRKKL